MSKYESNAEITERIDLTDDLFIIRISPLSGEVLDFTPGQYAELAIPDNTEPKLIRRAYSIASAPKDERGLELYIVKVDEGYLTPKLWQLKAGDKLWLGPKLKGKFTLDPIPENQNLVLISTGTGLAPFLSMYRTYKDSSPKWNKFVVIHGARYASDLGYKDELESYSSSYDDFHYIPSVTRESKENWPGFIGRVPSIFKDGYYKKQTGTDIDPKNTHVMLCGNPDMIDDMQAYLESLGFKVHKKKDPGNIHFERYW